MSVSVEACLSLMRHVGVRLGMLVSDQKCLSPMGFRCVSDSNTIFMNSFQIATYYNHLYVLQRYKNQAKFGSSSCFNVERLLYVSKFGYFKLLVIVKIYLNYRSH